MGSIFSRFVPLCSSTMSTGLFLYLVWWLEITRKNKTCNKTFAPISHPTSFRRLTNRVSDNVIILRYFICVHRLKKRPCHLVALRETKEYIVNKACATKMITGGLNFLGNLFFSYPIHNQSPWKLKPSLLTWPSSLRSSGTVFWVSWPHAKISIKWRKPENGSLLK